VPWADPGAGAVATQAFANPRYGPDGLALLRDGLAAEEVVQTLTDADAERVHRQLGVVDGKGFSASYTGDECDEWAGHRTGPGYAAQGNILVSGDTVDALAETFEASPSKPLAGRLLDCLDAAQAAGGDRRGQQSAAIHGIQQELFGQTPRSKWITIDDGLRKEIDDRLAVLGYESLDEWAGVENLEMRVDGTHAVDPVVLERLRERSA